VGHATGRASISLWPGQRHTPLLRLTPTLGGRFRRRATSGRPNTEDRRPDPFIVNLRSKQTSATSSNQASDKARNAKHHMQAKGSNNIAAAVLSSVRTVAPHGTCRRRAAQKNGSCLAFAQSHQVFAVGASRRAAKAAGQFFGAGVGRSVAHQRTSRPRHFAIASSSGIITSSVSLPSSPVGIRAHFQVANTLPPNPILFV
jgi:hypothetical protein